MDALNGAVSQEGLVSFRMKKTTMETPRCQFWLPKKKRSCANTPLNDSLFCGNHNPKLEDQRIPCPLDPSHFILKENLETHITKCPLLKQTQSLILQPFYKKGINGGTVDDDDDKEEEEQQHNVKPENVAGIFNKSDIITSEMKRNAVHSMTITNFSELIRKIVAVHGSICSDIQDSYKIPKACDKWINREVDRKIPFQEKHVLQQASILGNLEDIGVLKCPTKNVVSTQLVENLSSNGSHSDFNGISAVVEFGAGRGYLTQTLADCYGINKVILVERNSYKLKADRSLRQKESLILERLRIDIEDLNLNAVDSLKGVPYLAIGKHLCGPATDLTLRCCVPKRHIQDNAVNSSGTSNLRGLAIATCCHHLCQWKHYINKSYLANLGFTKDDFHVLTWFTSWAVDADHGSEISDMVDQGSCLNSIKKKDGSMDASGIEEVVRNMPSVERAVLGFMCKAIIDMGRLMWIKECGLEAELVKYVPSSISPENNLLVAK